MRFLPILFLIVLTCVTQQTAAQKKQAYISGKVVDVNENPLSKVSVSLLGKQTGVATSDSGTFTITVPVDKAIALVFSSTGFKTEQRNFLLNAGEKEFVTVRMEPGVTSLDSVVVTDQRQRREAGLVVLNPKNAINIPSPTGGIEGLIKVIVGSNNELSSQYSVRGGSYDENLIYVNDFEVFRPYLVRSGQQEGLSFINPELTRNVNFYNGGYQAKYGDKLSSVLDIQYRKPKRFGGSAYIGLLEQGLHLEGSTKNNKFSYLVGLRNRSNRNLLSSQQTQGNYVPSSADLQAQLTYQLTNTSSIEFLGNISQTKFKLQPAFSQLTSSVFSPLYTANLGLDIYFEGREEDKYVTSMAGLAYSHQPNSKLRLKWMLSRFENDETESIDITGTYLFGDREFDKTQSDFGLITNPLGAGVNQNFSRNRLNIEVWNASHKGTLDKGNHYFQWGQSVDRQFINDRLNEWEFQDSAGYSLPYNPGQLNLNKVIKSEASLDLTRISGYVQDNISFNDSSGLSLQAGVRYNYNTLNKELLISPRAGLAWKPFSWKRDVIFRLAGGSYQQPPFYRELRRYDGTVNTALKAQKSWQVTSGFDYNFRSGNRPFRFTMEAYYKNLRNVVPYDVDNVRLRYYGENSAKAYATGLEMRLFGELVKDAESWVSLGFMRTREDIENDRYYDYTLDDNNVPVDSVQREGGWLRRPNDRLITFGMFLQDYLSTNKNFKVFLNFIYGSNLPYNIPNSVKYRNALIIEPYIRIDLGFSALLLDSEKSNRRSHNPFRNFENIWATLEVFNLIDRDNTISYMLIKDFSNTTYALPNRLTPRLLNIKLIARF
ncbi:TonB-dependent receptor [Flavitalea sp.]|nr:TonB-dependent receptor [Flavitalea sp.]